MIPALPCPISGVHVSEILHPLGFWKLSPRLSKSSPRRGCSVSNGAGHLRAPGWLHRVGDKRVFLAAAERHTLIMRYGHGRETARRPIDRRSPDQPVAAALSPGLRRTQKVNIMMVLRADRARPAEAIARAMLAGRGTRRCRCRPRARHRARH